MSACDSCYAPGQCCKNIGLFSGSDRTAITSWADQGHAGANRLMLDYGFPFRAEHTMGTRVDEAGREYVWWQWLCVNLLPNGRCGDYENRPDLCRKYEAGTDLNCVHLSGESGDPTVPIDTIVPGRR